MTPDEVIEQYREIQLLMETEEKKRMEICRIYFPLKKCLSNDELESEEKIKCFTSLIVMKDRNDESRHESERLYHVNKVYEKKIRNLSQK